MKNFRLLLLLTLLIAPVAFAQNKVTMKGVVKSAETGEPLFGAYILVGGGGASTDENGAYSVTAAPGETLSYQYIGCVVSEFIVPSGQATVVHDVELKADNSLDDVVVVAYGVRKKGTIAGSVATVKSGRRLTDLTGESSGSSTAMWTHGRRTPESRFSETDVSHPWISPVPERKVQCLPQSPN